MLKRIPKGPVHYSFPKRYQDRINNERAKQWTQAGLTGPHESVMEMTVLMDESFGHQGKVEQVILTDVTGDQYVITPTRDKFGVFAMDIEVELARDIFSNK